jgi:hypothetical protein
VLGNEVSFEHRSPKPEDEIRVGMVDLKNSDKWIELGATHAWNWQQGCMLQWLPDSKSEVMWNARQGDQFVCHILDTRSGKQRTLPSPVYTVSPDGRWGLSPDFRRLNDMRPGYGYAGIPDPYRSEIAPDNTGIWKTDMRTGESKLLFSFAQIVALPHPPGYSKGAKHWFNHLLVSPNGKRFIFLHRWRGEKEGTSFATRMLTANMDGGDLHVIDPYGKTSHFIWRDADHILAWAWHPSRGERFYLYKDRTDEVTPIGPDIMTENGHCTYLPGNKWILNDTYPAKDRTQHVYLYEIATGKTITLGRFLSPEVYTGELRCDTHPRFNRSGKQVCIDSPHMGGRQMFLIDIDQLA